MDEKSMGSYPEWSVYCTLAGTIQGLAGVCVLSGRLDTGLVRT